MAAAVGAEQTAAPAATWEFTGPLDRSAVQAEIVRRAAAQRGIKVTGPSADAALGARRSAGSVPRAVATPLRRLRHLPPPPATSARPGVSTLKRLVRRIIAWEVDPLREQLADLQKATTQAAETADARLDEVTEELEDLEGTEG
jgi:hypothetical protein